MDELRLEKYELKPGDVFVVKVKGSVAAVKRRREEALRVVPEGVRVLAIDDSVRVTALTRAEIDARSAPAI